MSLGEAREFQETHTEEHVWDWLIDDDGKWRDGANLELVEEAEVDPGGYILRGYFLGGCL